MDTNDFISIANGNSFPDTCRYLEWRADHIFDGKRLNHHVIRSVDALDAKTCEIHCFFEPDCASFNFKKPNMSPQCELNNATVEEQDEKLETNDDYIYQGAEVSEELQSRLQLKYALYFSPGGRGGGYFPMRG